MQSKADVEVVQQINGHKATATEIEQVRKLIDRLAYEVEQKPRFADLDQHARSFKQLVEDLQRDVLLKASVKDVTSLLDQKVNVGDINQTLQLIQTEVERCVRDEDLRKALNEQALVNEALCAENCLGRWIWKSGDLYHKNQVPWEV